MHPLQCLTNQFSFLPWTLRVLVVLESLTSWTQKVRSLDPNPAGPLGASDSDCLWPDRSCSSCPCYMLTWMNLNWFCGDYTIILVSPVKSGPISPGTTWIPCGIQTHHFLGAGVVIDPHVEANHWRGKSEVNTTVVKEHMSNPMFLGAALYNC